MSAYLTRIDIAGVEEYEYQPSAYVKIVNIVEVVDQYGNPWEPVPGPDPWEDLVVNKKPLLHESNIYEIGETIYATTGDYIGGSGDVIYRWRWQTKETEDSNIVNGPWTSYDNTLQQTSWEVTAGGQVRFQCQAKDNDPEHAGQVNSFTSWKDVPYPPLSVGASTLTGQPYVGETVTASQPVVTGGLSPYTFDYMWLDSSTRSPSNSTVLGSYDEGKLVSAYVTVTDATGTQAHVTSNSIGPVEYYEIGALTVTNTDTDTDVVNNSTEEMLQGLTLHYSASVDGTVPAGSQQYAWNIRTGGATIVGPDNQPTCTIQLPTEFPGFVSISCGCNTTKTVSDNPPSILWNISLTE